MFVENEPTNRKGLPDGEYITIGSGESFAGAIRIEEGKIRTHVDQVVRETVEQTLNGLLQAEADELCGAKRYARSPERLDTRAGHYERTLQTKAGEVSLQVPRLRNLPFETEIIERYRRRESSVEEALVEMYLAGVSVRRVEGHYRSPVGHPGQPQHRQRAEPEDFTRRSKPGATVRSMASMPMCTWMVSG